MEQKPNFHFIETQFNEEIHGVVKIQIESDMLVTGGTTNTTYVYLTVPDISRKLIIEGNNHQIDFRAVSLCF